MRYPALSEEEISTFDVSARSSLARDALRRLSPGRGNGPTGDVPSHYLIGPRSFAAIREAKAAGRTPCKAAVEDYGRQSRHAKDNRMVGAEAAGKLTKCVLRREDCGTPFWWSAHSACSSSISLQCRGVFLPACEKRVGTDPHVIGRKYAH
jgi:hypothetical protein